MARSSQVRVLFSLSLSPRAHLGGCLVDLFVPYLPGCEVQVAASLPLESAGPGQVATRAHSSLMLSPLPCQPP